MNSTALDDIHDAETLESAVYTAIGAASMCWETLSGAGVFQSDRALEIGKALLERIEKVSA